MKTKLHELFQSVFLRWLQTGATPDTPIEGCSPEFTDLFGMQPSEFTFDSLIHTEQSLGWLWKTVEFNDIFDGQFFLYLPADWERQQPMSASAVLGDVHGHQQSVALLPREAWSPHAAELLEQQRVTAFAYYPLLRPWYHQWVVVTADDTERVTAYGVYSSGDWLVVVEGRVAVMAHQELEQQLTALVNTNPWYGWIHAAQAQP